MLGVNFDVMIRPGRHGELSSSCAEKKLHGWQSCLACPGQRHHHHLAWLLLLLCEEIVDRCQVEFLVQGKQVHVQHKQIPPHALTSFQRQMTARLRSTRWHDAKPSDPIARVVRPWSLRLASHELDLPDPGALARRVGSKVSLTEAALSGAAEPWWHGAVPYQLSGRAWRDTNDAGYGDLRAIIDRSDHLAWLARGGRCAAPA